MKNTGDTEAKIGFLNRLCIKMNNIRIFKCIREGLIMIVPVIMLGAFSLLLMSLPIDGYQEFIKDFASRSW